MYYLDMVKGRLYTYAAKSRERRAAQTAIYEVLNILVRMMAPILVFTSEDIWQHMPREEKYKSVPSVHVLDWPVQGFPGIEEGLDFRQVSEAIQLIPDVAKALEEKRSAGLIGSSFDARINLLTNSEERYKFLTSLKNDLSEIFKVSQVEITLGKDLPRVEVGKAEGTKCARCWNYAQSVGCNKEHPLICDNCLKAMGGI